MEKRMSSAELMPVEGVTTSPRTAGAPSELPRSGSAAVAVAAGSGGGGNSESFDRASTTTDTPNAEEAAVVCAPRSYGGTATQSLQDGEADVDGTCYVVPDGGAGGRSRNSRSSFTKTVRRFVATQDPLLFGLLKWGLAALLLLFLTFMVFGVLYSGFRYSGNCTSSGLDSSQTPHRPCVTPFGTILGVYEGVFGYSNCNDYYVSIEDAHTNLTVPEADSTTGTLTYASKQFYTGLAWQCVEYARRYWMMKGRPQRAYFGSVMGAADIWNLTYVRLVSNTSQTLPLHRHLSGDRVMRGLKAPEAGDIIIYPIQSGGFPVGHVAVITKVELAVNGAIYVAEQNWANAKWVEPYYNYSRKIPLHYDMQTTAITLDDPDGKIIGWMSYG